MKERLIVFDMDGTLYDLNDVVKLSYNIQVNFLSMKMNLSEKDTKRLLEDNHIYPIMMKESKSATEFFLRLGIDGKEWSEYREEHFDVKMINVRKAASEKLIKLFLNYGRILLLSSNTYLIITKILNHINISPSIFETIVCSDRYNNKEGFNKKDAMKKLTETTRMSPCDLLSIGDRYETDIAPAIELGGEGLLIQSPQSLSIILEHISTNNLHTNSYYEYYKNI